MRDLPPGLIPDNILIAYEVHNWRNALQVLSAAYPHEWEDLLSVLGQWRFSPLSDDVRARSTVRRLGRFDRALNVRGWKKRRIMINVIVDEAQHESRTYVIDRLKARVGFEIELSSDGHPFVENLEKFSALFDLQVLDIGIIMTDVGQMRSVLQPLIAGTGGGCPVLVLGLTDRPM